ncbi:MAG: hypothetical protein K2Q20_14135, partial [Phycisphaerales bacterium]|nr:hypothetical protein [Phycisphaerales bacterium]
SNAGGYFDQLIAAQAASARFAPSGPAYGAGGSYSLWTLTPGAGVNTGFNSAPAATIAGAGVFGQGLGLGFMEFGAGLDGVYTTGDDENSIISGLVNFQYRNPNRLFVQRTVAAVSKGSATTGSSTAAYGLGSVDESGAVHIYADDYGLLSTSRLTARNAVRVSAASRNTTLLNNMFQAGGTPGAGDAVATSFVRTQPASMAVPATIARSASGALDRPVLLTTDLAGNLIIETQPTVTLVTPSNYLPAGSSPRGSVAFIPQPFGPAAGSGSALGTAATLCRSDSNTKTRAIQVFGITSALGVDTRFTLSLPTSSASITDAADGFAPGTTLGPLANQEFGHYAGQATFRGSSSQVAMTVLPTGDLLVAATVTATGGASSVPAGQDNYIATALVPAGGGAPTWGVAAYVGADASTGTIIGKPILGRSTPGGPVAPVGRLARFTEAYGSASNGPSISSPAMDRLGNLYFLATVALDSAGGGTTFTTALLRASRDPATGANTLELITRLGDIVAGRNSGRNYQIQFLGVADADSVDSGTIFSSNITQDYVAGVSPASLTPGSPLSLGALAIRAKVVYDANNDGAFADPSGPGSGSTSPDQAYNVVLLVMPRIGPADFNRDGVRNVQDIFSFLSAWFASGPGGDWSGDGQRDVSDIFAYLSDWFAGD